MIRITDMTLRCVEAFLPSSAQLKTLFELLLAAGADWIELTPAVYEAVGPRDAQREKVILRISAPGEAAGFPEIGRFVCRKSGAVSPLSVAQEIQVNDVKEIPLLAQGTGPEPIRIVGLDDILCHDYERAFQKLMALESGRVEFCPENSRHCATAAAVEWIACGGRDIAVTFGGMEGKAALEEVLLALRVARRHKPNASYAVFPQIAQLLEEITGTRFPDRKPVIGRKIFHVESGIHIDGILKKPQMYEPFRPELVGSSRIFFVGKYSGRKAISEKLRELGQTAGEFDLSGLLGEVREESTGKQRSLTDAEFLAVAQKYRA